MYLLFAGIFGLILGSFYSVCASRYGTGKTVASPARSYCPHCNHQLTVLENIPLLSFLIQKGHCIHCRTRIPLFYPLIELVSMLWAILAAWNATTPLEWIALMIIGGICIVASAIDLRTFLLPDVLTYSGAIIVLGASYAGILQIDFIQSLLGAIIGAFALWAVAAVYKLIRKIDGMGLGDVKFMLMLGALTGVEHLTIFILAASVCALIFSIIAMWGKKNISTAYVPFGPFLAFGALITYLYGDQIIFFLH
ncbi:prepilin peptidase [Halodesulfovibrio aestuarii]|uniref:Prepilin leader peptidase/N-methyltransferase n=1 Tax=Halodesulfovibrio aestuarii TaxID=126333 RepID=A0ABV4JVG8_9BACT